MNFSFLSIKTYRCLSLKTFYTTKTCCKSLPTTPTRRHRRADDDADRRGPPRGGDRQRDDRDDRSERRERREERPSAALGNDAWRTNRTGPPAGKIIFFLRICLNCFRAVVLIVDKIEIVVDWLQFFRYLFVILVDNFDQTIDLFSFSNKNTKLFFHF